MSTTSWPNHIEVQPKEGKCCTPKDNDAQVLLNRFLTGDLTFEGSFNAKVHLMHGAPQVTITDVKLEQKSSSYIECVAVKKAGDDQLCLRAALNDWSTPADVSFTVTVYRNGVHLGSKVFSERVSRPRDYCWEMKLLSPVNVGEWLDIEVVAVWP